MRTFQRVGDIVAESFTTLLGPVETAEASAVDVIFGEYAANVVLSFVADEAEICVTLVLEPSAIAPLTLKVCAELDPTAAEVDDMVRELANIAAGAVKLAAVDDSVDFTMGLPVGARGGGRSLTDERFWWLQHGAPDARIGVIATVRHRANEHVSASQLREGMIVVNDVEDRDGFAVIPGGTRLTSTGADRVPELVGEDALIKVAVVT